MSRLFRRAVFFLVFVIAILQVCVYILEDSSFFELIRVVL